MLITKLMHFYGAMHRMCLKLTAALQREDPCVGKPLIPQYDYDQGGSQLLFM